MTFNFKKSAIIWRKGAEWTQLTQDWTQWLALVGTLDIILFHEVRDTLNSCLTVL
jgi:hypothetical protein